MLFITTHYIQRTSFLNLNPMPHSWVKTLHEDCAQQGLVDVDVFRHPTSVERLPCMTDLFMMGWEELIGMVRDEGMAAELRELFPGAVAETRRGLGYDMDRVTVLGRKI